MKIIYNWPARILAGILATLILLIGVWLGGYNFDERDYRALELFFGCIGTLVAGLTCPAFDRYE